MPALFLKHPIVFILLFSTLLLSCGQNEPDKKTDSTESVSSTEEQILLDSFSTFPPEIDGCACYFSTNETEFKAGKYIYADNYDSTAFVSINGVMTKFVLRKSDNLSNNGSLKTFVNDQYEITINTKQVGQIDETWQQAGTIRIKAKNGKEIIKSIYGECGC